MMIEARTGGCCGKGRGRSCSTRMMIAVHPLESPRNSEPEEPIVVFGRVIVPVRKFWSKRPCPPEGDRMQNLRTAAHHPRASRLAASARIVEATRLHPRRAQFSAGSSRLSQPSTRDVAVCAGPVLV